MLQIYIIKIIFFFEWLVGIIDGDGYFYLSKQGGAELQITMDIRDKNALYEIKLKIGGSIHKMADVNALRYRLWDKKHLLNINGLIRNPVRIV